MLFRTHLLVALFFAFLMLNFIENKLLFLIFVFIGNIIVDIDHYKSWIGRRLLIISWLINKIFGHRGIFHSLIVPGIVLILSYYFGYFNLGSGFFIGYLSHLLADCLTIEGVRMFWPLKFRIRGFLRTGGLIENVLFYVLVIADGLIFVSYFI